MGWSPHQRAQRSRTKLKRAARAYVEACDRLLRVSGDPRANHLVLSSEDNVRAAWRRLVHAAGLLTHALEGIASKD